MTPVCPCSFKADSIEHLFVYDSAIYTSTTIEFERLDDQHFCVWLGFQTLKIWPYTHQKNVARYIYQERLYSLIAQALSWRSAFRHLCPKLVTFITLKRLTGLFFFFFSFRATFTNMIWTQVYGMCCQQTHTPTEDLISYSITRFVWTYYNGIFCIASVEFE